MSAVDIAEAELTRNAVATWARLRSGKALSECSGALCSTAETQLEGRSKYGMIIIYQSIYAYIYTYIYTYIYLYLYIYIYTYAYLS